ncbi:DUF3052 domain-containing protein [Corynebacterium durum]|uniref:DUF3052 domain-containing protein n=1 Tax=Corynebacterium durum F0235 TaxID=1035195 RepID=L1MEY9_9CORY|nr:DUF3052 domain-containing protein [Corynebacterium durum]EKX89534.1 hypothetical protein HMPREF9997_01778 [Corynebacterium durum F0235]MDO4652662.1 DUF3052 domain-containing protein [Corynebacterium durum]NYI73918.1 hypothetical protein [Corynebacterium durum]WJY85642.1 hypothetical protein CDUR_09580 [Corynebacterium durum]
MVDIPGATKNGVQDYAKTLGIKAGHTVQEVGWDDDCDSAISEAVEDAIGADLLDEDSYELCDVVLLWWRDDDGDLVDELVDAVRPLADHGRIWLLSPAAGTKGELAPGVVSESAQLAGLVQTKAERLGSWQGSCLVQRGAAKRS